MTRYFENDNINNAFVVLVALEAQERQHPERLNTRPWNWMRNRARQAFVDAVLEANSEQ